MSEFLTGGGGQLRKLGSLGEDLGEIVMNNLARAARGRSADDFVARRAGAARFGGATSSPGPIVRRGAQRRGRERRRRREPGRRRFGGGATNRPRAGANRRARSGSRGRSLRRRTGDEQRRVERRARQIARRSEAARRRGPRGRRSLPRSGGEPNSAEAAATTAREHAEAMADQLERGSPAEAVKSGHNSEGALEQSERAPSDRFGHRTQRPRAGQGRARKESRPRSDGPSAPSSDSGKRHLRAPPTISRKPRRARASWPSGRRGSPKKGTAAKGPSRARPSSYCKAPNQRCAKGLARWAPPKESGPCSG